MFTADTYRQFFFEVSGKMIIELFYLPLLLKGSLYLHILRHYLFTMHGLLHFDLLLISLQIDPSLYLLQPSLFLYHQHRYSIG